MFIPGLHQEYPMKRAQIGSIAAFIAEPKEITQPLTLLFIHGMWATHEVWKPFLGHFTEQGYRCVAIDLRGHGHSTHQGDLGKLTIDDYVTDALAVGNALGDYAVVGHSMGGLVAQRVAHEADVHGAVLVTPAPPAGVPFIGGLDLTAKIIGYLPKILGQQAFKPPAELMNTFVFHRLSPEEQRAAYSLLVADSGTAMRDLLFGAVKVNEHRVTCPVLAISGHEDRMVAKGVVARVANKYACDYWCYARKSHWLVQEPGWEEVARDIHRWLTEKVIRDGSGFEGRKSTIMDAVVEAEAKAPAGA